MKIFSKKQGVKNMNGLRLLFGTLLMASLLALSCGRPGVNTQKGAREGEVNPPLNPPGPGPGDPGPGPSSPPPPPPPPPVTCNSATNPVRIDWQPATRRTNGATVTAADVVTAYEIHWGTQSGVYSQSLTIGGGSLTQYSLSFNLTPGETYYFSMRSVEGANPKPENQKSGFSTEVCRIIQ